MNARPHLPTCCASTPVARCWRQRAAAAGSRQAACPAAWPPNAIVDAALEIRETGGLDALTVLTRRHRLGTSTPRSNPPISPAGTS